MPWEQGRGTTKGRSPAQAAGSVGGREVSAPRSLPACGTWAGQGRRPSPQARGGLGRHLALPTCFPRSSDCGKCRGRPGTLELGQQPCLPQGPERGEGGREGAGGQTRLAAAEDEGIGPRAPLQNWAGEEGAGSGSAVGAEAGGGVSLQDVPGELRALRQEEQGKCPGTKEDPMAEAEGVQSWNAMEEGLELANRFQGFKLANRCPSVRQEMCAKE